MQAVELLTNDGDCNITIPVTIFQFHQETHVTLFFPNLTSAPMVALRPHAARLMSVTLKMKYSVQDNNYKK